MKVIFIYIDTRGGFSGQAAATELIIEGLAPGRALRRRLPHLDRVGSDSRARRALKFLRGLLSAYLGLIKTRVPAASAIHLSLGLTRFALFRDYAALLCAAFRNGGDISRIVTLNGSVFTKWPCDSIEARLFKSMAKRVDVITCVGSTHAAHLGRMGVPSSKIEIVPNVCEYEAVPEAVVTQKHSLAGGVVNCLFLSTLTDTKGYPEYLEALEQISKGRGPKIDAVLCGPISAGAYRRRFDTVAQAQTWIENTIKRINQSGCVHVEWIPGASGDKKRALFEKAQIFVLPTYYPVEAQPLALLEAMAHGCAIITTDTGEIPETVDFESAIILKTVSINTVAESIEHLAVDLDLRLRLAIGALSRSKSEFGRAQYIERWNSILARTRQGAV